jgi:hypothetical protein
MSRKVDFVFYVLRSKYCSWWERRVINPGDYEREVRQWSEALARYSMKQIKEAAYRCRERWQYRPPFANEFVLFMDDLASRPFDPVTRKHFDRPVKSDGSDRFFSDIKQRLGI